MINSPWHLRRLAIIVACVALAGGGCQTPPAKNAAPQSQIPEGFKPIPSETAVAAQTPAKGVNSASDPCANHLHEDVSAALLLYLSSHLDILPPTLADLRKTPGFENLDLSCPVSREPYAFATNGLLIPNDEARIVIYDAKPVHGGIRWGMRVTPRIAGRPPSVTVVPLTDEMFSQLRIPE